MITHLVDILEQYFTAAVNVAYDALDWLWSIVRLCRDAFILDLLVPSLEQLYMHVNNAVVSLDASQQYFIGTLRWLDYYLSYDGFLYLLETHAPGLHAIVADPVGWFLVQLTLAFDLEPWHTQSLEFLAKWILEQYFPTLYQIWLDPPGWLEAFLLEHASVLYYLWHDPIGENLYLIGQAFELEPYQAQTPEMIVKTLFERYFPELYLFWRDPLGWLREHIPALLPEIWESIRAFLENPWLWLLARWEAAFENIVPQLLYLAEYSLLFIWDYTPPAAGQMIDLWITGEVTEMQSPGIPGARVTVVGTDLSTTTDQAGRFEIRGRAMAAPSYTLSVSKDGYQDTLAPGVTVIEGQPTRVAIFMGAIVLPPEQNPAPRLRYVIGVYQDTERKLAWTQSVLETKRGEPTELLWQAQVAELQAWLRRTCEYIQYLQTQLRLYFSPGAVPGEYSDLLEFRC